MIYKLESWLAVSGSDYQDHLLIYINAHIFYGEQESYEILTFISFLKSKKIL